MISQQTVNYAKILFSLEPKEESIRSAKELLLGSRELMELLENPAVKLMEKDTVIDKLFNIEIRSFLKVLCENRMIGKFEEILSAYEAMELEHKNILKASLSYTIMPNDEDISQIKNMLCEKYKKAGVFLELKEDASLIGGFVLNVGDTVYDKSIKGALSEMQKTLIGR
jgi:F-type H+-transporting ATPase subunit delta